MNNRKQLSKIVKLLVIATLVLTFLNQTPEVSAVASQASLKSGVTVYLNNKQLMPSDQGQVALVTLKIDNQSSSEVQLIDYWARINGKSNKYVTKLSKQDETKQTVLPGNIEYITYYANVSPSETLPDINVDVIRWDFSYSNYEAVVGNLTIAEISQPKLGEAVSLKIGHIQLNTILEDQFVLEDVNNKIISYRMKLTNELNRAADISTFSSYVVINKSEVYEANTVISNEALSSKSEVYLYGQVSVPKDTVIDAMNIALVDKHGEQMYPLIVFPVDTLSERVPDPLDKANDVKIGALNYTITGTDLTLTSEGNRAIIEVPFAITNKSHTNGSLDEIKFYLKTKAGLMYSLEQNEESVKLLLPEIEETFTVTGFIPNEQALIDSQLLVGLKVNEDEVIVKNLSVGKLDITPPNESADIVIGGQEVHFERLTRTPNSGHDLIIAEFVLKNISKDSKKPLALGGQFVIDGVKMDAKETHIVRMNNNLTLQPNESERVIAYINVPFTQEITEYEFALSVDGKSSKTLTMSLSQSSRLLADNEKYLLKTIGKRGEVQYVNSMIYEGSKDNLFVVNVNVKNTEKRNVTPSNLGGYIQTKTGEVYQLSFETLDKTIMPNGTIMISGSTAIPKIFSTTDLTIHFGEQLEQEEVIYIDPVFVMYKPFNYQHGNLVQQVHVSDKKFWVWNAQKSWITPNGTDIEGFDIALDYQIDEIVDTSETLGDRAVLVEFIDLTMPQIRMTKEIPMTGDNVQLGRGMMQLSFTNSTIPYLSLTNYNINVYELYKGYKRIAASQQFTH